MQGVSGSAIGSIHEELERSRPGTAHAQGASKLVRQAAEDLLWALINHKEFLGDSRVGTVSPNGIGLFIPANLKLKDIAQIRFTLPNSKDVIQAKACVRSRSGFRYLFEFSDMKDTDREKIRLACLAEGTKS